MRTFFLIFLALLITPFSLIQAQLGPPTEWKKVDWAPVKPLNNGTIVPTTTQQQDESGEDWWYGHENIYDEQGNHIGYIATGYATWINQEFTSVDCSHASLDPNVPNCQNLQVPGKQFGITRATIARYDLGGNMIWCRAFNLGTFYNIIQSSSKDGFIAIGETVSLTDLSKYTPNTTAANADWLKYNPTTTAPNDAFQDCSTIKKRLKMQGKAIQRHMNVVKINNDGAVLWNHIYGIEDYAIDNGETAISTRSWGGDLVEGPFGNLRCVGAAQDKNDGNVKKIFMIDLDAQTGYLNWKTIYGNQGGDHEAKAIAIGQHNLYAVTGFAHDSPTANSRAFASLFGQTAQTPAWTVYADDYSPAIDPTENATSWDVDFDHHFNIIFPVVANMSGGPVSNNVVADGFVLTLKHVGGGSPPINARAPVSIGEIRAYDLKIGVTATSDQGFALVTSKILPQSIIANANDPIIGNVTLPTDPLDCTGGAYQFRIWNTDAYVAKYRIVGNDWGLQWDKMFDSNGSRATAFPGDIKKQECLYQITEADDGGFVISGNNSHNFDDDYLVKIDNGCQWFDPNVEVLGADGDTPGTLEIGNGEHVVWNNTPKKVMGVILIRDGGAMTISGAGSVIEFADSRKIGRKTTIIVERGGTLVINDEAHLTSMEAYCPNSMWDGIEVRGLHKWGSTAQGRIILNNCKIENARTGVRLAQAVYSETYDLLDGDDDGGGIIQADNATFENCRQSVYFAPYPYSRNNPQLTQSYIQNSKFICSAPMKDPSYTSPSGERLGIDFFIGLWDHHGANFLGNTYEITHTPNFSESVRGTGIYSYNASYNVECTGNCLPNDGESSFRGLEFGIRVSSNVTSAAPNINNNVFENITKSIFMTGVTYADITRNKINVGTPTEGSCIGLYLFNCNKYLVEDNEFNTNYNYGNIGIISHVSSFLGKNWSNEIYRNRFENLGYGIFGNGWNRSGSPARGLKIVCNKFMQNDYDILTTFGRGMSHHQGSDTLPARNVFDGCTPPGLELSNNSGQIWNYWYSINNPDHPSSGCYIPTEVVLNSTATSFNYEDECPELFVPRPERRSHRRGEFFQAVQDSALVAGHFYGTIDQGDTQGLLGLIQDDSEEAVVLDQLLAASPYLSDEVLLAAIEQKPTPLPSAELTTILLANSPLTNEVMAAVNNRDPEIESDFMAEIEAAQTGVSERARLESGLYEAESKRELAFNEWMRAIINPNYPGHILDTLISPLLQNGTEVTDAELISIYLAQEDYDNASQLINSLRNTEDWTSYCDFQQILLDAYSTDQDERILKEDPALKALVEAIAADPEASGSMAARNTLEFIFGTPIDPIIVLPVPPRHRPEEEAGQPSTNDQTWLSNLKVFPNPSEGLIYIEGVETTTTAHIHLRDMTGRSLLQRQQDGQNIIQLDLNTIPGGIYLLEIEQGGQRLTQKIIKH